MVQTIWVKARRQTRRLLAVSSVTLLAATTAFAADAGAGGLPLGGVTDEVVVEDDTLWPRDTDNQIEPELPGSGEPRSPSVEESDADTVQTQDILVAQPESDDLSTMEGGELAAAAFPASVTRLSGSTRYETAASIAGRYDLGVPAVLLSTGGAFPDALSAASAAASLGSPHLLTQPDKLPAATVAQISRLQPETICVLGGTGAVSRTVENQLRSFEDVTRIGGAGRYETSLNIGREMFDESSFAVVATGQDFPDALAASGVSGSHSAPVILVNGRASRVSNVAIEELRRLDVQDVLIAGGTGVVSPVIQIRLSGAGFSVDRRGGSDRYETAVQINSAYFGGLQPDHAFLATGTNFPDALAGAALAGRLGSPIYVTSKSCMPKGVQAGISGVSPNRLFVLGGTGAVSSAAAQDTVCKPAPKPSTPSTSPPAGSRIVTPGALCKVAEQGKIGYTVKGVKMVCKKASSAEKVLRWRAA